MNHESISDWRTYLGKQHEIYLKENEYTYQIVIDTLKKITPSKFKDSVSYSMNSTYKKIYERPNDRPKTETKPKSKGINDVWQDKLAKLNQAHRGRIQYELKDKNLGRKYFYKKLDIWSLTTPNRG
jgi:hypothetical protein